MDAPAPLRADAPPDLADVPGTEIRFDLYVHSRRDERGRVGTLVPARLRRLGLSPSERAWDFTSLAMAVVAADETVPRGRSPDGWTREIGLTVSVAAPDFWNTQRERLVQALCFLSGGPTNGRLWSIHDAGADSARKRVAWWHLRSLKAANASMLPDGDKQIGGELRRIADMRMEVSEQVAAVGEAMRGDTSYWAVAD